jgi:hypothetical protein
VAKENQTYHSHNAQQPTNMSSNDDKPWSCITCTFINGPIVLACVVCGTLRDAKVPVIPPQPSTATTSVGSVPRAKSPAKASPSPTPTSTPTPTPTPSPAKTVSPPLPLPLPVVTSSPPPIGFKLPIKARLDTTVRQFQLDRWIYSSLVDTTQRLFNVTNCLLFYGNFSFYSYHIISYYESLWDGWLDDEPKAGAPNLVPIRNDIG